MTILISGLEMSFGDVQALAVDDLEIAHSSLHMLVGANGAGKSTLLMIMAGLLKPTSGTVTLNGGAPGSIEARTVVSFVPDYPALFDDLTLQDQLLYVARLHGNDVPDPACEALMRAIDAGELLPRFPRAMSKGQRQKSGLAVGTARPFEILLLDEPTTALDATSRTALIGALRALADAGSTIVCSTHDVELIEAADSTTTLANGRLVRPEEPPVGQ